MFKNKNAAFGMVQKNRPGVRKFDRFGVAQKEHDAQLIFQRLDGAADGRLRNMQMPRGLAEALPMRDFREIF